MDDADRAQDYQSRLNEDAIARARAESAGELHGNGICIDCGEPIGERRLQACPKTLRCRGCQNEYEKWKKRRGI